MEWRAAGAFAVTPTTSDDRHGWSAGESLCDGALIDSQHLSQHLSQQCSQMS
jgi:hypothetical protein